MRHTTSLRLDSRTMALLRVLLEHSSTAPNLGAAFNEIAVKRAKEILASEMPIYERMKLLKATEAAEALNGTGRYTRDWVK